MGGRRPRALSGVNMLNLRANRLCSRPRHSRIDVRGRGLMLRGTICGCTFGSTGAVFFAPRRLPAPMTLAKGGVIRRSTGGSTGGGPRRGYGLGGDSALRCRRQRGGLRRGYALEGNNCGRLSGRRGTTQGTTFLTHRRFHRGQTMRLTRGSAMLGRSVHRHLVTRPPGTRRIF